MLANREKNNTLNQIGYKFLGEDGCALSPIKYLTIYTFSRQKIKISNIFWSHFWAISWVNKVIGSPQYMDIHMFEVTAAMNYNYSQSSEFWPSQHPVIWAWMLGNWYTFTNGCSIHDDMIAICNFLCRLPQKSMGKLAMNVPCHWAQSPPHPVPYLSPSALAT